MGDSGLRYKQEMSDPFEEQLPSLFCLGSDILKNFPGSLHFVCGISNFDNNPAAGVADNIQFRSIVFRHFQERLQDETFRRSLIKRDGSVTYKVVAEIDPILHTARRVDLDTDDEIRIAARLPDVRVWRKVGQETIKESTWQSTMFEDVTGDIRLLKQVLQQPLKTELEKQFPDRRNKMRELNQDEENLVYELCTEVDKPRSSVISVFSLYNQQEHFHANHYLVGKVSEHWKSSGTNRFVYCINARDIKSLSESYHSASQRLCSDHCAEIKPAGTKRGRHSPQVAAREFFDLFRSMFPRFYECIIIYQDVPHADIFRDVFLPREWLDDDHCQATIRGIFLSTYHPMYKGRMGWPFGTVSQVSVEWTPTHPESCHRYWWDRLPPSNLPFFMSDVSEPDSLGETLEPDGRAVALIDHSAGTHAGNVAKTFSRRWVSASPANRFAIWLNATNEATLRESYQGAIRRVTFSSSPIGNLHDLSCRMIADELMALLMKKMELCESERVHRWVMTFSKVSLSDVPFHEAFFSAKSNWFNSLGRFIVTTASNDIGVEVFDDDGQTVIAPLV